MRADVVIVGGGIGGASLGGALARGGLDVTIIAVAQAEDAENQPARREFLARQNDDPESGLLPLLMGAFAGPESVPDALVDHTWPDRIRAA